MGFFNREHPNSCNGILGQPNRLVLDANNILPLVFVNEIDTEHRIHFEAHVTETIARILAADDHLDRLKLTASIGRTYMSVLKLAEPSREQEYENY